jgi:hypothetical protein
MDMIRQDSRAMNFPIPILRHFMQCSLNTSSLLVAENTCAGFHNSLGSQLSFSRRFQRRLTKLIVFSINRSALIAMQPSAVSAESQKAIHSLA